MRAIVLGCFLVAGVTTWADDFTSGQRAARELAMPAPGDPQTQCEDESGRTWTLPLDQYQAGFRPQGPCLPVGTWDRMRPRAAR